MEDLLEKSEVEEVLSRRSFLKKAAYTAPAIITLGALNAHADTGATTSAFSSNTYDSTKTNVVSVETITTQKGTNNVLTGTHDVLNSNLGDYTASGSAIKTEANNGNETWTWLNNLFGNSNKWNGL